MERRFSSRDGIKVISKIKAHRYDKNDPKLSQEEFLHKFNETSSDSEEPDRASAREERNTQRNKKRSSAEENRAEYSRTYQDVDGEPDDIATRRGPRWEVLTEIHSMNYLFIHLLSYKTYHLRNAQPYLPPKRRTAIKHIPKDIPPR